MRAHSQAGRIPVGEACAVVELPTDGQPADAVPAVAIRRPSGEVLLVDAELVGKVGG